MDGILDMQGIKNLQRMLNPNEDEDDNNDMFQNNRNIGSVLNPGTIKADGNKKELAQPFSKIEAKVFPKDEKQINNQIQQKAPPQQSNINKPSKNDIWTPDEVQEVVVPKNDHRLKPEIEVIHQQNVGTEDVFLGIGGLDPSSTKCQALRVRVFLPGTKFKEVQLDVIKQAVIVQSPKYYAYHVLPYQINPKEGSAKWITEKEMLELSLPIVRNDDYNI